MVMAEVSKRLGAKKAVKLHYSTSGDINGDLSQVVGYASLAVV
jgi:AmmeMemoRadiSam system protein B